MLEMNKVMLIGNLTRDPEASATNSGMALAKFTVAVNRRFNNRAGEAQEEVAFIDVESWGKTAEFVSKWLNKGTRVYVEGRLKFDRWQDKSGNNRSKLSVTAERVQFALSKADQGAQSGQAPSQGAQAQSPPRTTQQAPAVPPEQQDGSTDDLPF